MNRLRVNKDTYKIEVNDDGEYIEFDLLDIDLGRRIYESANKIQETEKKYREMEKELLESLKEDSTEYVVKRSELDNEYYKDMRNIFDGFLGDGACKKIFGDSNRYGMFEDLFEQLQPHFDKMHISIKDTKKRLLEKYSYKKNDVI